MKSHSVSPLGTSAALLLLAVVQASAQAISYSNSGALYSESFDTLARSGTHTWADQVTLPGWSAYFAAPASAPATYMAFDGTTSTGGLRSFGQNGSQNRALGLAPGTAFGHSMMGISFVNNTGGALDTVSISYKGELWRGVGAGNKALLVSYQIGTPANLNAGSWTDISALTFNAPKTDGNTAYDGTLEENSALLATTLSGLQWEAGQVLTIRFYQANDALNKHLAIDDFAFTAVPEPETWGLMVAAAMGALLYRSRVRSSRAG